MHGSQEIAPDRRRARTDGLIDSVRAARTAHRDGRRITTGGACPGHMKRTPELIAVQLATMLNSDGRQAAATGISTARTNRPMPPGPALISRSPLVALEPPR